MYGGFIGKDVGKGYLYREIFVKKLLLKEVIIGIYCRYVYIYLYFIIWWCEYVLKYDM